MCWICNPYCGKCRRSHDVKKGIKEEDSSLRPTEVDSEHGADFAASDAPGVYGAPGMPTAPGMPKIPAAPGMPKTSVAPGMAQASAAADEK